MSVNQLNFFCSECQVTFCAKRSLNAHMKKFHGIALPVATNCECGICNEQLRCMSDLHKHMQDMHTDVQLNFHSMTFYSDEEYKQWKQDMEKSSQAQYVQKSGAKRTQDGRTTMQYFHCHRSGKAEPTGNNERHSKCGGSVKSGVTCPAYIKMARTEVNEVIEICVEFQSAHIGHDLEVRKMRLTTEERTKLAGMLSQGIPKSRILSDLRAKFSPTKRISLTNNKDLQNIERDFNINRESMLHPQDAIDCLIISESFTQQKELSEMVAKELISTPNSIDDLKDETFERMNHIVGFLHQTASAEKVKFINDKLKTLELYISMQESEQSLPSTSRAFVAAPAKRKIVPQPRLPNKPKKKKSKTCQ